jgi:hypothetical protein
MRVLVVYEVAIVEKQNENQITTSFHLLVPHPPGITSISTILWRADTGELQQLDKAV